MNSLYSIGQAFSDLLGQVPNIGPDRAIGSITLASIHSFQPSMGETRFFWCKYIVTPKHERICPSGKRILQIRIRTYGTLRIL